MSRVLVTGASGFVGRRTLAPLLEQGFEVHACARRTGDGPEGVTWHAVDLLDRDAARRLVVELRCGHLLHLAWYAEHGRFWSAPENLDWTAASLHLLRAFREAGGERAVLAGTCAEYDWGGDCCDAATALRPQTLYGAAKDALRRLAEAYAAECGLSLAWGRIFFAFGPGEQPGRVVAAAARALLAGEEFETSSGTNERDFLFVDDLGAAFATVLTSAATGALDLGSGDPVRLADLLARIEAAAGGTGLLRLGAVPDRDEPRRIVADSTRLRELGWAPRVGLEEGIERTLAWWRDAGAAARG